MALHPMVRSAITVEDEANNSNPDGPALRPRHFHGMAKSDMYAVLALLQTARSIDGVIPGVAPAPYEPYREIQGSRRPGHYCPGPEVIQKWE